MQYRLASLEPKFDLSRVVQEILAGIAARFPQETNQQRADLMRAVNAALVAASDAHERMPDLLDVLAPDDRDRPWLSAFAETVAALRASGRNLRLVECERMPDPDGFVAVAIEDPGLMDAVRQNDYVSAGCAALRGGYREPIMWPRILRKICSNGAIIHVGDGAEQAVTAESLPAMLVECLSATVFAESVGRFAEAATQEIADPVAMLTLAGAASPPQAVVPEWRRAGDTSLWGLINAATALARDEQDPAQRFIREQDAERILRAAGIHTRRQMERGAHRTLEAPPAVEDVDQGIRLAAGSYR